MRAAIVTAMLLLFAVTAGSEVLADGIKDAPAAIKTAQHECGLPTPKTAGKWQVSFVKNFLFGDEWHVWFGKDAKEPICGFYGAVVKADGSYTSCRVSACSSATGKP